MAPRSRATPRRTTDRGQTVPPAPVPAPPPPPPNPNPALQEPLTGCDTVTRAASTLPAEFGARRGDARTDGDVGPVPDTVWVITAVLASVTVTLPVVDFDGVVVFAALRLRVVVLCSLHAVVRERRRLDDDLVTGHRHDGTRSQREVRRARAVPPAPSAGAVRRSSVGVARSRSGSRRPGPRHRPARRCIRRRGRAHRDGLRGDALARASRAGDAHTGADRDCGGGRRHALDDLRRRGEDDGRFAVLAPGWTPAPTRHGCSSPRRTRTAAGELAVCASAGDVPSARARHRPERQRDERPPGWKSAVTAMLVLLCGSSGALVRPVLVRLRHQAAAPATEGRRHRRRRRTGRGLVPVVEASDVVAELGSGADRSASTTCCHRAAGRS